MDFRECLRQDHRVVLAQPVLEELVGHPDADGTAGIQHQRGRFEPGIEAMAVDLRFDSREDLVPDADFHTCTALDDHTRLEAASA